MLRTLVAVVFLGLASPAASQQAEIRGVIQSQIEAFVADDVEAAFTFASPAIKNIFGSAETFGGMVRRGYPMVWRPQEVQFLGLEAHGGVMVQKVLIRDGVGALHVLDYEMVPTPEGWQINSVQVLRQPVFGA